MPFLICLDKKGEKMLYYIMDKSEKTSLLEAFYEKNVSH